MHLHILGICGTFMGGLARLAIEQGHTVSGCDANVYPPMSDQLAALGIQLIEGYSADQRSLRPDLWIIGNVVSRGNPLMEALLEDGAPFVSGPQWLAEHVLCGRWVAAVAGTHGKTTTTSMLAWILTQHAQARRALANPPGTDGLPGFLIGGVPLDFGVSARLGDKHMPFVVEADEYDTAFFDKRSKFVHYRPRTLVLNNLEYDHADIFADLAAIETQFHHLVRTVPARGLIVAPAHDAALQRVLARGCWTPVEHFADAIHAGDQTATWQALPARQATHATHEDQHFRVRHQGPGVDVAEAEVQWSLLGAHNRHNALAAIASAVHMGVPLTSACEALGSFQGVARRMQLLGEARGVRVLDDFAHHPTAIATTLAGARHRWPRQRLIAVFEPRSNTMKQGAIKEQLPAALRDADLAFCHAGGLGWDARALFAPLGERVRVFDDLSSLQSDLLRTLQAGDQLIFMSNGGFGGLQRKVLEALQQSR